MPRIIKQAGVVALIGVLALTVPWLLAEGIYSLVHRTSLAYELYLRWFGDHVAQDPSVQMITNAGEISALLGSLRDNAVAYLLLPHSMASE